MCFAEWMGINVLSFMSHELGSLLSKGDAAVGECMVFGRSSRNFWWNVIRSIDGSE